MEEEIFRDIESLEGEYQISNYGRVKSLARRDNRGAPIKECIRKPTINQGRVLLVTSFYRNGCKYSRTNIVSVMVAKAFPEICGEWFEGCEVHHKDQNPLNNRADNLICLTKEAHYKIHHKKKEKKWPYMNFS